MENSKWRTLNLTNKSDYIELKEKCGITPLPPVILQILGKKSIGSPSVFDCKIEICKCVCLQIMFCAKKEKMKYFMRYDLVRKVLNCFKI